MKCPVCKHVDLMISERQKIEIDYCPDCRGVWLDRGELDKIIDRVHEGFDEPRQQTREPQRESYQYHHKKKHKKKSFFDDLFDWD